MVVFRFMLRASQIFLEIFLHFRDDLLLLSPKLVESSVRSCHSGKRTFLLLIVQILVLSHDSHVLNYSVRKKYLHIGFSTLEAQVAEEDAGILCS